ncbi:MAG: hypothetical protein H0V14_10725 [Chitinophagaceae bacterium]|nr:hypothetical protein [Chitinophagaceae bacterium]
MNSAQNTHCILFISTNDGSDMRINKEVRSLAKHADIIFLGVGDKANCYVSPYCKQVFLIRGKRNSAFVLIKQVLVFLKLLVTKKISSIHVINEQLYIFFYPFLFFKHTVLDLFDSIFLRKNIGGEKLKWIKQLVYWPANKILVTDENRYNLMPQAVHSKCLVLPNFPEYFSYDAEKESSAELRILYNGWMGLSRGTEIIEGLLETKLPLTIFMAGWFSDDYTAALVKKYPGNIQFLGTIPQRQALKIAQQKADYILCVYAPINQNNINASPNKVYDAIQTRTPLIINTEVKVSEWVKINGLGFILKKYHIDDYTSLYNDLNKAKGTFKFSDELKMHYTWERTEDNLFKAHKIK